MQVEQIQHQAIALKHRIGEELVPLCGVSMKVGMELTVCQTIFDFFLEFLPGHGVAGPDIKLFVGNQGRPILPIAPQQGSPGEHKRKRILVLIQRFNHLLEQRCEFL